MLELQSSKGKKGQQYRVVRYWKDDIGATVSLLYITAYSVCQLTDDPICLLAVWQYMISEDKQKVITVNSPLQAMLYT